ncbi:MAG: 4a-hydroxytetrahydrobiopterin dehydratase [Chitinophagaceae bacterium]
MEALLPEGWILNEDGLCKEWIFPNFIEAFAFMTKVAFLAEKADHHPNWNNVYNKVFICLNTHDAGGAVTEKDYSLASAINQCVI